MSCWCSDIKNYKCFDCENVKSKVSGLEKTLLLRHARLCLSDSYDLTKQDHNDLIEKIAELNLCITQLSARDIKNIGGKHVC